jgi:hypothetical protein
MLELALARECSLCERGYVASLMLLHGTGDDVRDLGGVMGALFGINPSISADLPLIGKPRSSDTEGSYGSKTSPRWVASYRGRGILSRLLCLDGDVLRSLRPKQPNEPLKSSSWW